MTVRRDELRGSPDRPLRSDSVIATIHEPLDQRPETAGIRQLLDGDVWIATTFGVAVVLLVGGILSGAVNIWIDEAFTLHSTGAGPIYAWNQAAVFEEQPPLYFVLEALWRLLDESSIAFARIPSVIFSALAVAVLVVAAKRIAPRVPPIAVATATATNPIVLWAANEMRVYPLVLLVGALLSWTLFEGFLSAMPSRRGQILYGISAVVGLYTQYYVGFFLAAQGLTVLAVRRGSLGAYVLTMVGVSVAFVPLIGTTIFHVQSSGLYVHSTTLTTAFHEVCDAAFVFILPHEQTWSGVWKTAGFSIAAVVVIALVLIGRPRIARSADVGVIASLVLSLVIFTAVFSSVGMPQLSIRYLIVFAPVSLLTAFVFLSSLQRQRRLAMVIAIIAYASFTGSALWIHYRPTLANGGSGLGVAAKSGDWQRVAATIAADDRGTPIGVFPPELGLPLHWYLPATTIPIPRPLPFRLDYVQLTTLTGESDVARVLDPIHAESDRLWLVTRNDCSSQDDYYNYNCRFIESYLRRRYRLLRSVALRGTLVRLYRRLPAGGGEHRP